VAIRIYPEGTQDKMSSALKKLFTYPIIQILAVTPTMIYVFTNSLWKSPHSLALTLFVSVPFCLVGFLLSVIFLIQQSGSPNLLESATLLESLDRNIGGFEEDQKLFGYKQL